MSEVTIDMSNNAVQVHHQNAEPWKVTLVDTGEATQTGGRVKRIAHHIDGDFCLTYGDGVSSVDIGKSIAFHKAHGKLATMTTVQPPGRFGALDIDGTKVKTFLEKPKGDGGWINGGFFVLNPKVFDLIEGDQTIWERRPLEILANQDQLQAYFHEGFWQCMDTLRDKTYLEDLWTQNQAPWKSW